MKNLFREKLRYKIDKIMSKGTGMLVLMLLSIVVFAVVSIAIIADLLINEKSTFIYMWESFMYMLDAGNLNDVDITDSVYVMLMLFATLFGLLFSATLISLITNALSEKIEALKQGDTKVLEKEHTVLLGYNERAFTIVTQLVHSYEGQKKVIVIAGTQEKSLMEKEMKMHLDYLRKEYIRTKKLKGINKFFKIRKFNKNIEIICRSGKPHRISTLEMCNVVEAKSIIVTHFDDYATMKTLLGLDKVAKNAVYEGRYEGRHFADPRPVIVAIAMHKQNKNIFRATSKNTWRKEVLYFKEQFAKVTAHSCFHPGISTTIEELFTFKGSEIYIQKPRGFEELFKNGKKEVTMKDIREKLEDAILIGVKKNSPSGRYELLINPNPETMRITENDELIIITEDYNLARIRSKKKKAKGSKRLYREVDIVHKESQQSLLIIGCNENLPFILAEANKYLSANADVIVACTGDQLKQAFTGIRFEKYSDELESMRSKILLADGLHEMNQDIVENAARLIEKYIKIQNKETVKTSETIDLNINIKFRLCDIYNTDVIRQLIRQVEYLQMNKGGLNHLLLLSNTTTDKDTSDAQTLFLLMNLRQRLVNKSKGLNVTTEMRKSSNQQLASKSAVDDFIVSENLVSNMIAQISEQPDLSYIFQIILDVEGAELYLESVFDYVEGINKEGVDITFAELSEIIMKKYSKIPIGYRRKNSKKMMEVVINPILDEVVHFEKDDMLVVLSDEKRK